MSGACVPRTCRRAGSASYGCREREVETRVVELVETRLVELVETRLVELVETRPVELVETR
jgi:hypothetical protein